MRSEHISLITALAIHAGVLLVARAMPPLELLKPSDQRDLRVIDIELPETPAALEISAAVPSPAAERPDETRPPEAERPVEPRAAGRTVAPTPGPEAPATAEPAPANTAPTAPKPGSKFDELPDEGKGVLGVPGVPGIGGNAVWAMPGVLPSSAAAAAPAPTVAPAPRPVDRDIAGKVVREAMNQHDKDLGLDLPVAGSISSAVRTAVQVSDLAVGTRGSIECRVGPGGQVSGCRLLSSTAGGPDAWGAAVRAAGAVAGAALPGQYAHGAIVTIDINVSQQLPAGSKGGLSGASLSFDVSNLGAHAVRTVRTIHRVIAAR